ncbi:MAG: cardiolipin synthase [Acetatifactor sp.]|nr:cardiolipin synthase [Acetatifactor sp.]
MSTTQKKNKKLGNIKTVIYGRTAMILVGFLAQLTALAVGYLLLRSYSIGFYAVFLVVSAVAVVRIFNVGDNPDMKLSWMLPMALFPVFGAIFYMTIVTQPGTKVMYRKLKELAGCTARYVVSDPGVWDRLRQESPHMGQLARYLYCYDNSPAYENTQVKYFSLGDEQFPVMLEELRKAEKYIFMEFFIVSEGRVWDSVLDILREKAAQGVEVRFMYDGTCVLFNLPAYYSEILEEDGIRCKMFAPIKPIFSPHYNNRDHRKILVIDGKVAFTGGINLADEYINEKKRFGHWKDTGIMVKGDAVERFTFMFLEMWNESERHRDTYERFMRPKDVSMPSDGYVIPYSVCPLGEERVGERVYLDIINTAHTYVHIMTPYLILDYQMLMALVYAAKRGVEVVIIMPHIPDKKYAFMLAKTYYEQLLEAGVRICEYEPGFVHAKVFVSDDVKAVVGTVNLDFRSLYHHFECGVILYKSSQVAVIEQDVQDTLQKCLKMSVSDYGKLKLRDRVLARVMRLIAPLL